MEHPFGRQWAGNGPEYDAAVPSDAVLIGIAQLAVTLAGFAGVVAVFRQGPDWTAIQSLRLRVLVQSRNIAGGAWNTDGAGVHAGRLRVLPIGHVISFAWGQGAPCILNISWMLQVLSSKSGRHCSWLISVQQTQSCWGGSPNGPEFCSAREPS